MEVSLIFVAQLTVTLFSGGLFGFSQHLFYMLLPLSIASPKSNQSISNILLPNT